MFHFYLIFYKRRELRLIESMDAICDTLLDYNIHKGVKVDLGIPHELWDKPSAEVTNLKAQCEKMIEQHEADIEQWYFHHQADSPLGKYLCEDRVLRHGDAGCLSERLPSQPLPINDANQGVKRQSGIKVEKSEL